MPNAKDSKALGRRIDELTASAELFRLFAEATQEGVIIHDLERILAANEQFARMHGSTVTDIVGSNPFSFVIPELRPDVEGRARRHEAMTAEGIGMRVDGTRFPVEATSRSVSWQGRRVRIVRVYDLSRRKEAEENLAASEERFRATFELAALGIAHVAPGGTWLRVNRRICEIVGYSREELQGLTFQDITHPDDLAADLEHVAAILDGRIQSYSMEKRYFRKDRAIVWVNLTVALARKPDGEPDYFISIIEDITARKVMEERLRQSQKMEVMGQLTSSIAHDFGNFLNVIKGNLQLLEPHQGSARARGYLSSALAGADLAERLIRQLLQFSRREDSRPEIMDISRVVTDMSGLLRRAAGDGITIALDGAPCMALCDRTQFETSLLNLVLNARDAILPKTGKISIKTSIVLRPLDGSGPVSPHVKVAVTDTGAGMPADVAARACDPFFTTKAPGIGTGLGLAQVARFVESFAGGLDIDSTVGSGTTVSIFIPEHRAGMPAGPAP